MPFVAFGRPWDDPEATHPWVDVDGAAGGELATRHLLESGHERIAWIGWRKDSPFIGEDRRVGLVARDARHARPRAGHPGRGHGRPPAGRRRACCSTRRARAFVCASDTLAMGVLHTLAERGLQPGRDIAVVGFDDSQVAQVVPPGLTSVRQPLEEVAVELVRALEGLLARAEAVRRPAGAARPHAGRVRAGLGIRLLEVLVQRLTA